MAQAEAGREGKWWVVRVWSVGRIGKLPLLQWRVCEEGGEGEGEARLHAMSARQALWQKRAGTSNKKCKAEGSRAREEVCMMGSSGAVGGRRSALRG